MGTNEYAAPEQKLGFRGAKGKVNGDYDSKVDVYPIGVMLFEFLIGQEPLSAECYQ